MQKTNTIGKSFTLGKKERLKSRKLIERVFRDGKSFAIFPLRVYYLPIGKNAPVDRNISVGEAVDPLVPKQSFHGSGGFSRLQAGFGASSRNFKKAVDRNRIKRVMREAYRLQKEPIGKHLLEKDRRFAVFFIYTGKELPDYQTVYGKIGLTLQRLMKEIQA